MEGDENVERGGEEKRKWGYDIYLLLHFNDEDVSVGFLALIREFRNLSPDPCIMNGI